MISVNRSSAANYHALSSLRRIDKDIAENQTRVATGLKVRSAADDAMAFAAAKSIRSDLTATDTIKSGLAIARGRAEATVAALNKITNALSGIQRLLAEAQDAFVDGGMESDPAWAPQAKSYQGQIKGLVNSVAVKGVNWLTSTAATTSVIKLGTDPGATITFAPTQMLAANAGAGSLKDAVVTDFLFEYLPFMDFVGGKSIIAAAIASVAAYTNELNGLASSLSSQSELLAQMDYVRKSALGNLVNADLSAESARSRALQARQQLAYQALSIGNSKPSNILALFR